MKRQNSRGRSIRGAIQTKSYSQDKVGGSEVIWSNSFTINGYLRPASIRETERAQQTFNPDAFKFFTRYKEGINPQNRLVVDNQYYSIEGVTDPTGERMELILHLIRLPTEEAL